VHLDLNIIAKNNIPVCTHENILKDISKKYGNKIEKCADMMFPKNLKFKDLAIEFFDVHHKDINISKTLGFTFSHSLNKRQYKIEYVTTDAGKICIESNYNRTMLESSFRPHNNKT
jgi:hypothetical protein